MPVFFIILPLEQQTMKRIKLGILLILMMFGHNFVLNQTQSMQKTLTSIHNINITQFNLLYSLPSAISILFIIPMGFFYQRISNKLLWAGAITLALGQLVMSVFGGDNKPFYFQLLMIGRIIEGIGAEILYMIQGNMASSWMGKYAGIVFILPQFGQIANVFITPWSFTQFGVGVSFFIGFLTCLVSSVATLMIYYGLTKRLKNNSKHIYQQKHLQLHDVVHSPTTEIRSVINTSSPTKDDSVDQNRLKVIGSEPTTLFQANRITWFVILLCGINQCLYFPFLDNANQLVTNRFCIPYEDTGFYLSIPFISAMITSAVSSFVIPKVPRHKLMLYVSLIPLLGHSLIFFDFNCEGQPSILVKTILVIGLGFFGMGIGTYYSVSFPAVGLSVPQNIRGMAYACMAFFQTISLTLIPLIVGQIIESETKITKLSEGYREESLLFVIICFIGVIISGLIYNYGNENSFIYNDENELEQPSELIKFRSQGVSTNESQSQENEHS